MNDENIPKDQKRQEEEQIQAIKDAEYDAKLKSMEKKMAKQGHKDHLKKKQCLEKKSPEKQEMKETLGNFENIKKKEEEKYMKMLEGLHKNEIPKQPQE